jgi:hypothetical protein
MASGSLRPGSPSGAVRASRPSLAENFAGSSRSTPVVSVRPISKISASSIASRSRLPRRLKKSFCVGRVQALAESWRSPRRDCTPRLAKKRCKYHLARQTLLAPFRLLLLKGETLQRRGVEGVARRWR